MKNVLLVVLGASVFIALSCRGKQEPAKPSPPELQYVISDEKSAFCIMPELTVFKDSGSKLSSIGSLHIGEKVALAGQAIKAIQSGKQRDFILIRQDSGAEGFVRADCVASRSILAVITADAVPLFTFPRNTAATGLILPRMSIIAISRDTAASAFIRFTCYNTQTESFLREHLIRNEGLSSRWSDVESAILYRMASRAKNRKQREAFLNVALADHPGSAFAADIEEMLDSGRAEIVERPTEKLSATMVAVEEAVSVRSGPDESKGSEVATLSMGQEVVVEEKTTESYAIGDKSAPWYRLREPAGWVYGVSLQPAQLPAR